MRHSLVCVVCEFAALVLLQVSSARAAQPLNMTWQAPSDCPTQRQVEAHVLQLAQLKTDSRRQVAAEARVIRSPTGFELTLIAETEGVRGERKFEAVSCQSVVDAAALTLALMLNPEAEIAPEAPVAAAPRPEAAPDSPAALPGPVAIPANTERPHLSARWSTRLLVGAGLGLRTGALPKPGVEPGLELALLIGPLAVWLNGNLMPAQSASFDAEISTAGARLWLHSAGLRVGWQVSFDSLEFGPVLGVEATRAVGRGTGISEPEQASIRWLSGSLGVASRWNYAERFSVSLNALALAPLRRPRFVIEEAGSLHQPQRLGMRVYFSLAIALW